jgi:hypothetical protein
MHEKAWFSGVWGTLSRKVGGPLTGEEAATKTGPLADEPAPQPKRPRFEEEERHKLIEADNRVDQAHGISARMCSR